ncbi:GIY-YIG nuclease family protein [Streptomyces sp. NPDC096040]|uniref:GIY-YIG nuclease family protein n=1 Tax=Streptomyces sp. NPDC096040 TaxID=3155541 RepID=UPI003331E11B
MADPTARCLGMDDGGPCTEIATATRPVPLCTPHRIEVAMGVVPDALRRAAGALDGAALGHLEERQARLVERARAVPVILAGAHAPRVYVIEHGHRVKIGYTTNLRDRLGSLCLRPSNVVLTLQGGLDLERALHAYFAPYRLDDTEWFRYAAPVRTYVEERTKQASPSGEELVLSARSELVAAVMAAVGADRGVHLGTLLPTVAHLGIPDRETLRQRLDAEGIPVRRTMRTSEGAGRSGVHRDDLVRLFGPRLDVSN